MPKGPLSRTDVLSSHYSITFGFVSSVMGTVSFSASLPPAAIVTLYTRIKLSQFPVKKGYKSLSIRDILLSVLISDLFLLITLGCKS